MIFKTKFLKSFISSAVAFLFIFLLFYAPYFLSYSSSPINADVIIILKGPDYISRNLQVQELIAKGFAYYIILPDENQLIGVPIKESFNSNRLTKPDKAPVGGNFTDTREIRYFEHTHIELIRAKNIMDSSDLHSAIIVSSPYHMRRIKLISDRVFKGANYRLSFIPTCFEKPHPRSWFFRKYDLQWILQEYIKIIWFCIYELFGSY